jgi:DNA-binding GntR family transcriptional regulator
MPDPIPLRGLSLHDGVATRLRAMIFDAELAPGDWVDEKALAQAWQISRTPLREALKVLASEGLVELVPHRGCRVIEISDDDADDLFPVMALLEGRCALEAVHKVDETALARLRHLHAELERHAAAKDLDQYYRANHEFHACVQSLADNRWLNRVTGDLRRFLRLMRGRQLQLPGRIDASINEHRVLMDAFEQRDAVRAERAMHDHLLAQLLAFKKLRQRQQRPPPTGAPVPAPSLRPPRSATAARRAQPAAPPPPAAPATPSRSRLTTATKGRHAR